MHPIKIIAGLILPWLMMLGAPTSQAVTITLDENGQAIGTVGQGSFAGNLLFQLPFNVATGFLLVAEDPRLTAPIDDELAFFDNGVLAFSSDPTEGADSLADQSSGFAIPISANVVRTVEVGLEGSNGVFYTPLAGQPGFSPDVAVTYHILSDTTPAVPEPATLALLASGLCFLPLWQRRAGRRRRNSSELEFTVQPSLPA